MAKTVVAMQARSGFTPRLPGGVRRHPKHFDTGALTIGATHELEHTSDRELAVEIAMAHLAEDPNYYAKDRVGPSLVRGRLVR